MNIPIVYEDNWLFIVDKPAGLLTIPTPKKESRTLTSIINEGLLQKNKNYRLYPCHRLDRDTSGLLIYAKGKSMQKKMMAAFKERKVAKKYIAFVQGRLSKETGEIKIPLEGRSAVTQYKVAQRREGFDIVEVFPLTGRTNQIRIHFRMIGHPVVGETKYAFRRDYALKARYLCLHAQGLEFTHPETKKPLCLYINLPQRLEDFLSKHN